MTPLSLSLISVLSRTQNTRSITAFRSSEPVAAHADSAGRRPVAQPSARVACGPGRDAAATTEARRARAPLPQVAPRRLPSPQLSAWRVHLMAAALRVASWSAHRKGLAPSLSAASWSVGAAQPSYCKTLQSSALLPSWCSNWSSVVVLSCLCGAAGLPFSPTGRLPPGKGFKTMNVAQVKGFKGGGVYW